MLDISDPKQHPDQVLRTLFNKLNAAAAKGDEVAKQIKKWVGMRVMLYVPPLALCAQLKAMTALVS